VTGIRVPVAQTSPPQTCGLLLRNECHVAIYPVYVGTAPTVHSMKVVNLNHKPFKTPIPHSINNIHPLNRRNAGTLMLNWD